MFIAKYTGVCLISISSRRKLCWEKLVNFFSVTNFSLVKDFTRQILGNSKSLKLKKKRTSNNSLGNRALLDMKYYKISPGCLCFISH